ncbi:MAG: hypothetical protein EOP10_15460 [Proteobacteria bacterium]|nr:MAG: hypothetical protein EOP10_15460 [Pseudomonadota bacterium]
MSFIPPEQLDGPNLIAQFIIEYRGRGHFLPYDDHLLLRRWLKDAGDADTLLLILSDLIPKFFATSTALGKHPPSLTRLDKKVCRILEVKRQSSVEMKIG